MHPSQKVKVAHLASVFSVEFESNPLGEAMDKDEDVPDGGASGCGHEIGMLDSS